jgi:splicing factor 4
MEMAKTAAEAQKLTATAEGKHHIGDFLPPEELSKFMDKYKVNSRRSDRLTENALGVG